MGVSTLTILTKTKNMKKIFFTVAVVCLMSCSSNEEPIIIRPYGHQWDQIDSHPTDSCGHLELDSLKEVSELLEYLESIPATHR
jgi:hypothetical protein